MLTTAASGLFFGHDLFHYQGFAMGQGVFFNIAGSVVEAITDQLIIF